LTSDPENLPARRGPVDPLARGAGRPAQSRELLQPRSRPLSGEVLSGRALPYEPEPDQSMLRNPYLLAGTAVAGAIVLAVIVVFIFGGSGGSTAGNEGPSQPGVAIDPLTPQPGSGVSARSIATATVREGPSPEYLEIGTLRSGQDVDVIGRNQEATWFRILFPPRSSLSGWVPATALRVPEASVTGIPIALSTPISRPTIVIPTSTPEPPPPATPTSVATATATVTTTATAVVGPDLVVGAAPGSCNAGARLVVNVRNNGPAPVTNKPIAVLVQTADGVQRAFVNTSPQTIGVGDAIAVDTSYTVSERVVAVVDPLGTLGDQNVSNNRVDCVVGPAATPTRPATNPTSPASIATALPYIFPPPIVTPTTRPN
jgi:hypothetical protein